MIAAIAAALLYLVAEGPYWFKRTEGLAGQPDQARWLSQEIRGNRTAILTMIGGSLAAFGAFITYQNLRVTRRGHQTDRFAKAVEMLAEDRPAVRLGGVYALNAIALESPLDRQAVSNVLTLHSQSNNEVSAEADRAAAQDVVVKLTPSTSLSGPAFWSLAAGTWWKLSGKTWIRIAVAIGAIALISGVSLASQLVSPATDRIATTTERLVAGGSIILSLAAGLAGARASAAASGRARAATQRPLFSTLRLTLEPSDGGGWDVISVPGTAPLFHHASMEHAEQRATELLGQVGGGELVVHAKHGPRYVRVAPE